MKYQITYTISGFIKVFVDVVEANSVCEAEVELQKLVNSIVGGNRKVSITFIKSV